VTVATRSVSVASRHSRPCVDSTSWLGQQAELRLARANRAAPDFAYLRLQICLGSKTAFRLPSGFGQNGWQRWMQRSWESAPPLHREGPHAGPSSVLSRLNVFIKKQAENQGTRCPAGGSPPPGRRPPSLNIKLRCDDRAFGCAVAVAGKTVAGAKIETFAKKANPQAGSRHSRHPSVSPEMALRRSCRRPVAPEQIP